MNNREHQVCCSCGIEFSAPAHYFSKRRQDGKTFYCPNGHKLHFGESETDKLRRERDRLKQRVAQKDDEIERQRNWREGAERSASAYKGQATRLRNRIKAGVCPCCNRTFQNLQRHIAGQHPEFKAEAEKVT